VSRLAKLCGGLRGLNPDLSGHLPGASSSALVVGMPSQEGGGGVVVPSPFRGSYFDSFDESELPKKSANMTERVAVPSSEHVAEIVGRQGEWSRGNAIIVWAYIIIDGGLCKPRESRPALHGTQIYSSINIRLTVKVVQNDMHKFDTLCIIHIIIQCISGSPILAHLRRVGMEKWRHYFMALRYGC